MNTKQYIDQYLLETQDIIRDIDRDSIDKCITILFEAWKNGKKVITMGNGGSASTASHIAGDLLKTVVNDSSMTGINPVRGFKSICLNDNSAAFTAWVNDSGWDNVYAGLLNTLADEGDVIFLVSVHGGSGWSGNIVKAMNLAKSRGVKIVGFAGFDGGKIKEMADAAVVVPKNSTPHTEGFHGVVQHLMIFRLKELVSEHLKSQTLDQLKSLSASCGEKELQENIAKILEKYGAMVK